MPEIIREDEEYCCGCNLATTSENIHMDCTLCFNCCDCNDTEALYEEQEVNEIVIPFKKIVSKTFKQNPSRRFCGVEIECLNKDLDGNEFKRYEFMEDLGFSQLADGSLDGGGVEYVSQAFNGDELFKRIKVLCLLLKERKFKVNTSCGLHIHIEVKNYSTLNKIKKILAFYEKYENYFYRMVSPSRQNNRYCKPIKEVYPHIWNTADQDLISSLRNNSLANFKKKLYNCETQKRAHYYSKRDKYQSIRYCWLNLHSLFYHGTLEVRLHNGTIEPDKINKWLALHLRCIDIIEGNTLDTIKLMPRTEEFFLSLFKPTLKKYIIKRWGVFKHPQNINGLSEVCHV